MGRRGCTRCDGEQGAYAVNCLDADPAVAFVTVRYQSKVLQNASLRILSMALLAISFALVGFVPLIALGVLGTFPPSGRCCSREESSSTEGADVSLRRSFWNSNQGVAMTEHRTESHDFV